MLNHQRRPISAMIFSLSHLSFTLQNYPRGYPHGYPSEQSIRTKRTKIKVFLCLLCSFCVSCLISIG
ncbi:hypothetical protein BXJ04_000203 [Salmonella enterica subsp. enterica]|nr:hypothetical protein [Salmonella enterica subsp. enterica]